jgi:hypothetical protein
MSGGLVMSGSLERFTTDELIEVVRGSQQPMCLSFHIGQQEVGRVEVQGGAVEHCSFGGLRGPAARGAMREAALERFEVRRRCLPPLEDAGPAPANRLPDGPEPSQLRVVKPHLEHGPGPQRPSVWCRLTGDWTAWG